MKGGQEGWMAECCNLIIAPFLICYNFLWFPFWFARGPLPLSRLVPVMEKMVMLCLKERVRPLIYRRNFFTEKTTKSQ